MCYNASFLSLIIVTPFFMELKYRADIDGLRGIAVLAVLFFHTGVPGFSGGFVGVDVFFVISGYLITTIILKDLKNERFSIAQFYERRIRRIFPALFSVIAFTIVVGAYLFDATAFDDLGQSVAATTLFASNIFFWRNACYFAEPSLQMPLLHTWSLAVEEQFYIFFPLALLVISRWLKGRYLSWLIFAFILSFAASEYGVLLHHVGITFYMVPTRAWELMAGSLLALGVVPNPSSAWQKNLLAFGGIILLILSITNYTEETPFPGIAALIPVMGSALIILSGKGEGTSIAQKLLTMRPLVFVGLISYSLYLWHWPLVAFTKYIMIRPFNGYDSAGIILASLLISTLSWRYIEQPFRGKQMLLSERKWLFAIAGFVMVVASAIGGGIYLQHGMAWRYPEINIELAKLKYQSKRRAGLSWKSLDKISETKDNKKPGIVIGNNFNSPTFVVWGDSHAWVLFYELERIAIKNNVSGYMIMHTSHLPLRKYKIEDNVYDNAISYITSHPEIRTVIMMGYWSDIPQNDNSLFDCVKTLWSLKRNVVIISDVPTLKMSPYRYAFTMKRLHRFNGFYELMPTAEEYKIKNRR